MSGAEPAKNRSPPPFELFLTDKNVEGILVNIFGGIMDCNVIAHGIVDAARETHLGIPLVVRAGGQQRRSREKDAGRKRPHARSPPKIFLMLRRKSSLRVKKERLR